MSDFILHQYPTSPFSEKIRLMLGYAGIDWLSVQVREMPPRPLLEPLAAVHVQGGGHRVPRFGLQHDSASRW